ncbi:FAD/NAD(P)-binding domain-containing protein [Didymella exigua CBS 183.55]|uniref:FAD/NAD(P)-binding domain-containing protein n=1 Tax=Didymella exigua CBS 183.55 TaxID=1150837 RepID=A0A6A5RH53_9PLEO|nr:FAD/NAD(P)-binding domain-containing protein [Didymella exigua CBS 183.55]KAF1927671.1 FAD/NAD(P)-binding domain-containing protein [Didymella exigua CBS 183.55]
MGNIGNLNRAYKPHSSPNTVGSGSSPTANRIHLDLPTSNGEPSPMLRRAAGRIPNIGIVGAGVAGLRCAEVLLKHGAKVTIFEGRNRVGGRFCQGTVGDHLVDLGPNWIHGTDNNPMLDLAKETNTITMNWDGRQSVVDALGKYLSDKEAAENTEIVWSIIEQAMKHSDAESATIEPQKSLYDFFEEAVQKLFVDEKEVDAKKKRQTILKMSEMWGSFVGSDIQKQSLKFLWLEECIDGENLFVAGTYKKVLEKIAQPAEEAGIRYNTTVKKLISKQIDEGRDPSVAVEYEDAEGTRREMFDDVVMTAPLGWLKTNLDAFEPALPKRLQEGIAAIGYGHLDKVYITFPTAFWNLSDAPSTTPASRPSAAASTLTNVPATTAPVRQLGAADSPVNPSHYAGFTSFVAPTYATATNPQHWSQEAMNLAALPGSTAHPTLLFYTHGATSQHIADLVSRYPDAEEQKRALIAWFEPYFSRLPNYDAKKEEHNPSHVLATLWANDELAGYGSYANFQVGLERGNEDVEVMRLGVPERGIWLAGEHTAPFVALGTVTGAWWSGDNVANRIVRVWGLGDTS